MTTPYSVTTAKGSMSYNNYVNSLVDFDEYGEDI